MSANEAQIFIPKHGQKLGEGFSRGEIIESFAYPGRRTRTPGYQSPATHVTNLADARQAIQLCEFCRVHFNPRKERYRIRFVPSVDTSGYTATGPCDVCNQRTSKLSVFVAEEIWEMVSCDPQEARIRARMAWQKPGPRPSVTGILNRIQRRIAALIQRRNNHG